MRVPASLSLAAMLLAAASCVPKENPNPEWMKPPKAYQPQDGDLTFNRVRLEQFNLLSEADREAYVQKLQQTAGSFQGQAILKSRTGLGKGMPDSKYGDWELQAGTEEVLYEITIDYSVFTTEELGHGLAPHRPIKFSGTLVELRYQSLDKPRKLSIKVKADDVAHVTD